MSVEEADARPLLSGLRVLEVSSGVAAAHAGRLLAILGADVTCIEPAAGAPLRQVPPFLSGTQTGALHAYLSAGKRRVDEGSASLGSLLEGVDILLEDVPLARKAAMGVDPDAIAQQHPQLVHVSVLPFGAVGPKAGWKAQEVNLIHAVGEGNLLPNGISLDMFPQRAPLKIAGEFTSMAAGVATAMGTLAAVWARPAVGGQFLDISVQDCGVALSIYSIQQCGDGYEETRATRTYRYGGVTPCRDGYVELLTIEQKQWLALVELMGNPAWAQEPALMDPKQRSIRGAEINQHLREWAKTQAVDDVVRAGQQLKVPVAKYATPAEILAGAQERARGIFAPVDVEGVGPIDMFGAPFHLDGQPLRVRAAAAARPAPAARNAAPAAAASRHAAKEAGKPLAGVRILDMTLHAAGPFGTHMLAQLGADCFKIESSRRPDNFRQAHTLYGRLDIPTFAHVMAGKQSVRIDLKHPRGAELIKRIVAQVDIVAESFRPGVMERLGIGYEALKAVKPDIILVSSSASGQDGPEAHFGGYAPLFGAWGGVGALSGHPDGPPLELRHFMDHAVGYVLATSALAALHRRRTQGLGAHIDISAREVACAMIGDAFLQAAHGDAPQRLGNRHAGMAPHGVYPAQGDDRWVSIAVASDNEWRALAQLMGPALPAGMAAELAATTARVARWKALDELVCAWSRQHDAHALAMLLQSHGIAAHPSVNTRQVVSDEHLRWRQAVFDLEVLGAARPAVRVPVRMSKTSCSGIEDGHVPPLGGGEDRVFGELLGMTAAERGALEQDGVII